MRVVGEQFAWTFFYERGRQGGRLARSCTCRSTGQVKFTLQSKDVLHDFWVPAFRMKKDAVPGIDVTYRVTPNRLGAYPIVCAELCGLGHAVDALDRRRATRRGVRRLARRARQAGRRPPAAGGGGGGARGRRTARRSSPPRRQLRRAATRWPTRAPNGTVGPDLDKVLKGKDEAFIKQSIVDPSAEIADGYQDGIMPPNFGQTLRPGQDRCAGEVPF